ncbi:hypothetical protein SESBI_07376 [Sesbania bispinosa]|nr:hypothetical protein SESBI_07376 [Sesbania bispinosa]
MDIAANARDDPTAHHEGVTMRPCAEGCETAHADHEVEAQMLDVGAGKNYLQEEQSEPSISAPIPVLYDGDQRLQESGACKSGKGGCVVEAFIAQTVDGNLEPENESQEVNCPKPLRGYAASDINPQEQHEGGIISTWILKTCVKSHFLK